MATIKQDKKHKINPQMLRKMLTVQPQISNMGNTSVVFYILFCPFQDQGHLPAVLSYLSGQQISEACCLAQESGDHRLALLLAQAVGNQIPRQMIERELSDWAELGVSAKE